MSEIPADRETEGWAIAAILGNGESVHEARKTLKPKDFFDENLRHIYKAIEAVDDNGEGVNELTVAQQLARENHLDDVGGLSGLSRLISSCPSTVGASYYFDLVAKTGQRRELYRLAVQIAQEARKDGAEPDSLIDLFDERLIELRSGKAKMGTRWHKDVIDDVLADVKQHIANPRRLTGISTGWPELDYYCDGLATGCLYLLAAETGIGKSLVVHNIINYLGSRDVKALIISTEMGERAIARRVFYLRAQVDKVKMRRQGEYDEDALWRIEEEMRGKRDLPIGYFEATRLPDIMAEIRRQAIQNGVKHFFVDHLDDIVVPGKDGTAAVDDKTKGLHALALRHDIHITAVSQLARVTDNNRGRRLNRLKDGSGKEQAADVALFIEPVNQAGETLSREQARAEMKRLGGRIRVRCHIEKNRDGSEGFVDFWLDWNRGGKIVEEG